MLPKRGSGKQVSSAARVLADFTSNVLNVVCMSAKHSVSLLLTAK